MVRTLIGVLIAATVVGVSGAQPQPSQEQAGQQQPSVFRSGSDLVRAYVTVTDKDGRIVTTLQQDDFEVRDEGKVQPIILFDRSPRAIRLIVMLDVSGSMTGNLPLLRNGTAQLVKHLRTEDRCSHRHVRQGRRDQSLVHTRARRIACRAAVVDRSRGADAALARHRQGDRGARACRGRCAARRAGAQRRCRTAASPTFATNSSRRET